jgi:squalene-associated FAD-dependent desaturase
MKAVVVGGGLAGLAAALDLVDRGNDVTLLEARPTLGGAVQTLPEREGDPAPPPDNGQHIALGCFEEYLRFLDRIGSGSAYRRLRLSLPVVDEEGRVAAIGRGPLSLLRYRHLSRRERLGVVRTLLALRRVERADGTFGDLLRRFGETERTIARFWDVFVRPALNLRADEVDAGPALFTVRTALLGSRAAGDLILPEAPLGEMHGGAARRALEQAGAAVVTGARVDSLDELDTDAIVVATGPRESARLLGEPDPALEDSPIVSVHLRFDRPLVSTLLVALLESDAHWIFNRSAIFDGRNPGEGQYLTVVSSGVPELMEIRGRELVDRLAGEVTARLGHAEVTWSRVSREPAATIALRPGVHRPGPRTEREMVVRAGAWAGTGWPATMEGAVRSGRTAAALLAKLETKVTA